jgi:hypothetical protein
MAAITRHQFDTSHYEGVRKPIAQPIVWKVLLDSRVIVNVPPASLRKVAVERVSKCRVPRAVWLGRGESPVGD